jgi:diguanylate cyclase (GGDEF)-like protein
MSGQDTTSMLEGAERARAELRERCLALVRRWHPLAQNGWEQAAARKLGEEVDQIAITSERLGLEDVNTSALELEAYLCSFVDDHLVPNERNLCQLADMVNRLGSVLTDLSATATAEVHALPSARIMPAAPVASPPNAEPHVEAPAAPEPMAQLVPADAHAAGRTQPDSAEAASGPSQGARPTRLPRAVCLVGLAPNSVPGLAAGLGERGYDVREFADGEALLNFLGHAIPGALLLDARKLRIMARVGVLYTQLGLDERLPAVVAISQDGDLGHRLLAMRAGASALFSTPIDSLRVVSKLDELLAQGTQPEWRVLIVDQNRVQAADAARCLVERGMTARLTGNGQAALAALSDFRPDVIVIDCDLPDVRGIELIQLIRQQPEYAAVPIIFAADAASIGQRFDAIAAGGDEFLLKPIKARHLLSAVQARAQRAHWLREMLGTPGGRDSRTGLYSRTTLIEKLEITLGDRSAALMFIALDHSRQLREQIGLAGLAALDGHIGNILRSQLDEADVSAQYQDFHYFTLMHRRSRNEVTAAAERIRAVLNQQPWQFNGHAYTLTASLGMAMLSGDQQPGVDAVVNNAQAAQIAAAHLGGNRVLWFEAKEAALLPVDPMLAVRAVLSRPLTPEQTQFEFQPIVPLGGKLSGQYEVGFKVKSLQHPGTAIAYADLAPVAAECNQIGTLDRWLLQHALEVREDQLRRGRQLRLFVPQAVTSALEPEFAWWLSRELKQRHLSGTGLTIELACSALIDAGSRGTDQLKALHQHGVRFCLVDYGRDWAAVHALKNLDVDFVRLASELVAELGNAKSISDTLLALVRKAHGAGAAVIAPEVDSLQRAHLLLRLGVDYGIGPAFTRPQPQPDFDFNRPLW